jgi:hypothetical protein
MSKVSAAFRFEVVQHIYIYIWSHITGCQSLMVPACVGKKKKKLSFDQEIEYIRTH